MPSKSITRLAAALLLVTTACGPSRFDRHIREYLRLAVALGERDPDSIDFYYGPPEWVADVRKDTPTLDQIRTSALELADELKSDPEPRAGRIAAQVRAIAARAGQLRGASMSFDQEAKIYFGVTVPPADPSSLDATRAEIDRLLPGSAAPGETSLADRYAAFDEKFLVPNARLQAVLHRAMQGCREETLHHLRLPAGESVSIEYVRDKPWSAFSYYKGNFHSVIEINADLPLTVDRVLALACHEGYPGHHVQNVTHDLEFVRKDHWLEWMVQPTFSPTSLVSEAMATVAADVAFPGEQRVRFERDALFPLAGLDPNQAARYNRVERLVDELQSSEPAIARDYIDGNLEFERANEAFEKQALMAHAEETLKYINEYRSYMITYTLGREMAARKIHGWPGYEQFLNDPNAAADLVK